MLLGFDAENADISLVGRHEEMLADGFCQHSMPGEVEMASKDGLDGAVLCADEVNELPCVGVGFVGAIISPSQVSLLGIALHADVAQ